MLFSLATVTCAGRIFIRLFTRRRLFLDDAFLLFAWVSLVGSTAILGRIHYLYLYLAVLRGDMMASLVAFSMMDELLPTSDYQLAYLILAWTTVFAIKWCYLAFFYPLLRAMAKSFLYYYWFAIAFSVVSWLFLVIGEQMISCPYAGKEASRYHTSYTIP